MNVPTLVGAVLMKRAQAVPQGPDQVATMAAMVAGKLRDSGTSPETLEALKRELEEFNIREQKWNEPDWILGDFTR